MAGIFVVLQLRSAVVAIITAVACTLVQAGLAGLFSHTGNQDTSYPVCRLALPSLFIGSSPSSRAAGHDAAICNHHIAHVAAAP